MIQNLVIPLVRGVIAVGTVIGIGKLALRPFINSSVQWYWRVALFGIAGFAVIDVVAQTILLTGEGSSTHLRDAAYVLVLLGTVGHFAYPRAAWPSIREMIQTADKLSLGLLAIAFTVNLAAAIAPSTKIDEIFYHMLVPKRIVQDSGLQFYFEPIEAAITPQMHYQMSLSIAHAIGAPEAGNVLSWAYSGLLALFIFGLLSDVTKRPKFAAAVAAACLTGEAATVLYTTSGPHSRNSIGHAIRNPTVRGN